MKKTLEAYNNLIATGQSITKLMQAAKEKADPRLMHACAVAHRAVVEARQVLLPFLPVEVK